MSEQKAERQFPPLEHLLKHLEKLEIQTPDWYGRGGTSNGFRSFLTVKEGESEKYGIGTFRKSNSWEGSWENGGYSDYFGADYILLDIDEKEEKRYVATKFTAYGGNSRALEFKKESIFTCASPMFMEKFIKQELDIENFDYEDVRAIVNKISSKTEETK